MHLIISVRFPLVSELNRLITGPFRLSQSNKIKEWNQKRGKSRSQSLFGRIFSVSKQSMASIRYKRDTHTHTHTSIDFTVSYIFSFFFPLGLFEIFHGTGRKRCDEKLIAERSKEDWHRKLLLHSLDIFVAFFQLHPEPQFRLLLSLFPLFLLLQRL